MKELPKYFVIKSIEHPLWDKYINWLNEKYCKPVMETYWTGININYYYGYDGNKVKNSGTECHFNINDFINNPTLITLEEWDEYINGFKLHEKWCVRDCKEVSEWASKQFNCGNTYLNDGYLCIDQNKFPSDTCYVFDSLTYSKKYNYKEITFEQFEKYVLKQNENMIDFKVKGTKLPFIPSGTEFRAAKWSLIEVNDKLENDYYDFTSFGFQEYNYDTYILCEHLLYRGCNHFMIKESDIIKLAKEQNMINERKIIGYKAPYDLFEGKVKTGDIFKLYGESYRAKHNSEFSGGFLPKEIVETWEPVYEEEFKIGDWVYVVNGGFGAYGADDLVGTVCTKEEALKLQYSGESREKDAEIYVICSGHSWGLCSGFSLRKATKEEILSVMQKTLYFGDVEFIIKIGEDFASTPHGKVYKSEIKSAIDYIENPPRLNRYELTIHVNNNYSAMMHQVESFKIGFGCKSGTLHELKEILKAFD